MGRAGVLTKLYELKLTEEYEEPIGYDGTILHAIERVLPLITELQGFKYSMTYVDGVYR